VLIYAWLFNLNERKVQGTFIEEWSMQLITRIRVAGLVVAAVLAYNGLTSALYPSHKVIFVKESPSAPGMSPEVRAEFVTSQPSRWFGIFEASIGVGVGSYVLWRALISKTRCF
jgi:hypothetical protein